MDLFQSCTGGRSDSDNNNNRNRNRNRNNKQSQSQSHTHHIIGTCKLPTKRRRDSSNNNNNSNTLIANSFDTSNQNLSFINSNMKKNNDHNAMLAQKHNLKTLTEELNAMSVNDRNHMYEEMHGVSQVIIEETPEMVAKSIEDMKHSLRYDVPKELRKDLDKAVFLRPSIQTDETFHLLFLRAKRFQTLEAAQCMCSYFTVKSKIFGEHLLVERITINHLSPPALQLLREGSIQFLKGRETTGRVIQLSKFSMWDQYDYQALSEYTWYVFMTAIQEDEEIQKKGIVGVSSLHGDFSGRRLSETLWKCQEANRSWPVHFNCIHLCFDNPAMNVFMKGVFGLFPKEIRIRQRLHFGSVQETKHSIMSFGINIADCFEEGLGTMATEHMEEFINHRRQIEVQAATRRYHTTEMLSIRNVTDAACRDTSDPTRPKVAQGDDMASPKAYDVLMGRVFFHYFDSWKGNVALQELVVAAAPQYHAASDRLDKSIIVIDVIQRMKSQYGSRFVERTNSGWVEVSQDTSRKKVFRALRIATQNMIHTA